MASVVVDDDALSRSRNSSVDNYFIKVDNVTREAGFDDYVGLREEITRSHWKSSASCLKCSNPACRKSFNKVFGRPHHCRKCGELFCDDCTQYKRRLNKLAHFDPDGQPYKVCKACFQRDLFTGGQTRSYTPNFTSLRSTIRMRALKSGSETASTIWKNQHSFEKECQRLLDGFATSTSKSDIMKTLDDMMSVVSVPEWMKSSIWLRENGVTKCRVCDENFGLIKTKVFCRVCGISVCKSCSTKDLLLYVMDGDKSDPRKAKMAIIKIVGCPEVEPEISLYIRVCPTCKEKLISKQVGEAEEDLRGLDLSLDFMETLNKLHDKFHGAEEGVGLQLPNYTVVVESLEDGSRRNSGQNNMKVLAKEQEDLADALAHHVTLVQQLKKLQPRTGTQIQLLKTYTRAKCEFYMDNMSAFRRVKHKLSNSVPADCLDVIQRTMDKNAIISTHLALRQLVYEVLHLTESHHVNDDLPAYLVTVEQEIENEVKKCLRHGGDNIEEHMNVVKEMTKTSMKDHKLIRLPRTASRGDKKIEERVEKFVLSRTEDILNQVINQLQLASANRSFQTGKKSLDKALLEMKSQMGNVGKGETDFVMVDKKSCVA